MTPLELPAGGQQGAPLGDVYLLHFSHRYRHAGHYLGWTQDLEARLDAHLRGVGARLLEVATDAGITWDVVRVWPAEPRATERRLKNAGHVARLCPLCADGHRRQETAAQRRRRALRRSALADGPGVPGE